MTHKDVANTRLERDAASWSERFVEQIERAQILQPADAPAGNLDIHALGPLQLVSLRCGPASILRGEREIGHCVNPVFTFVLQVTGRSSFVHCGHQAQLGPGDFTMCYGAAPYSARIEDGSALLMLRVPAAVAREHLPTPSHFCGRRLAADQGLASTAASMTETLFRQLEDGLSRECGEQAGRHLLGILASSLLASFDDTIAGSSIMVGRYLKVKLHIEQHLRDSELSPATIAERLNLSSRYLRMIFTASNESPSAFILRRRLEECARQLANPGWRGHSITEIAFSWGFNSASHFTRSFRERFRLSPREYRQRELARLMPHHVPTRASAIAAMGAYARAGDA